MPNMSTQLSRQSYEEELEAHPYLGIYSYSDFFASTWLASHVRFVEFEMSSMYWSNARMFIDSLMRDARSKDVPEWVWRCYLVPLDVDDLARSIRHALGDIEEGGLEDHKNINHYLKSALDRLDVDGATEIFGVSSRREKYFPVPAHEYGPTYMTIWKRSGCFYYLEIHNES